MPDIHSTGRGGAGNIGNDKTVWDHERNGSADADISDTRYTDGEIVREGPLGYSADNKDYSSGRGGVGNIGDPAPPAAAAASNALAATPSQPGPGPTAHLAEDEYVPEPALHTGHQSEFHTGRGGEGNIHKDKYGGHSKKASVSRQGDGGEGKASGLGGKLKHALGLDKKEGQ